MICYGYQLLSFIFNLTLILTISVKSLQGKEHINELTGSMPVMTALNAHNPVKEMYYNWEFYKNPVIVPKRATLVLDRLMVALLNAVEEKKSHMKNFYPEDKAMSLQRRGQEKGHLYWRCYFNAVTCF